MFQAINIIRFISVPMHNGGGGGGEVMAVHCIPSHSVHCYKIYIVKFDNYWGRALALAPLKHSGSDGPAYEVRMPILM